MSRSVLQDRQEAGALLAQKLKKIEDPVVYALPRGGVETALPIAQALNVPIGLIITRKIGHPANPEYAVGAITDAGATIWNESEKSLMDPLWLKQVEADERDEAKRRREKYLADRQITPAEGKTAIIVDDGIATGLTMRAAVQEILRKKPKHIIVAVPVAPQDTIDTLLEEVDEVITLIDPLDFLGAVGAHYQNFPQLTDQEVIELLASNYQ